MTRVGEGMQVPCTLHFKGHKKFIDILKKLNWTDPFSVMQRKTEYTAASKCFGLQYYVVFDSSRIDKRGSSYQG